ncbi:MAG TPA: hypothetical protein VFP14_11900 [Novosphingobium sp.]|nr:hypothetical protein [Novosphingobium sp.]
MNAALLGLVALVPAALNAAPAADAALAVPLCSGDGLAHVVSIPLPSRGVPGGEQPGCCAKGCHAGRGRGSRRKCQARQIDAQQ